MRLQLSSNDSRTCRSAPHLGSHPHKVIFVLFPLFHSALTLSFTCFIAQSYPSIISAALVGCRAALATEVSPPPHMASIPFLEKSPTQYEATLIVSEKQRSLDPRAFRSSFKSLAQSLVPQSA
eukprot:764217-Hanusia_phi.AAC.4